MSVLIAAILVGIGAGFAVGGRLRNLACVQIPRWFVATVWAGLALQLSLGFVSASGRGASVRLALLLTSYIVVVAALVALLRIDRRGTAGRMLRFAIVVAALGWTLNFAVIAANGGMPISETALQAVGGDPAEVTTERFSKHVVLTSATRLPFLADVLPTFEGGPVISAGDISLAAGVALFLAAAMAGGASPVRHAPTA